MTRAELIERIACRQSLLAHTDVDLAVRTMIEHMTECLASGGRIEIRQFGSFSLHFRRGRVGRNPRTGTPASLPSKYVPHFKPGKVLRERVDRRCRARSPPARPLRASSMCRLFSARAHLARRTHVPSVRMAT